MIVCGKCGKLYINKRGLKQHMIRLHGSKSKYKIKNDLVAPLIILTDKEVPVNDVEDNPEHILMWRT